jgi:hypothetical protein
MSTPTPPDFEEFFEKLSQAIAEWEHSPYYLMDEEFFDLERFLLDHKAEELREELERIYGKPLNQKFWTSFLSYQRLRRAREEVKAQEADQDKKRQEYTQAVERGKRQWQEWLKEFSSSQRRSRFKVIRGGKKDT